MYLFWLLIFFWTGFCRKCMILQITFLGWVVHIVFIPINTWMPSQEKRFWVSWLLTRSGSRLFIVHTHWDYKNGKTIDDLSSIPEALLADDGNEMVMTIVVLFLGEKSSLNIHVCQVLAWALSILCLPIDFPRDWSRKVLFLSVF